MSKVNVPFALLSLATSVLLWASVYNDKNDKPKQKPFTVPIRTSGLDEAKFVIVEAQEIIPITVSGYAKDLRLINSGTLTGIVDLRDPKLGEGTYPVAIFPASVRELMSSSALTARFKIDKLVTKRVEVAPRPTGTLKPGVHQDGLIDTFPNVVYVTGPSEAVAKIISIQVIVNLAAINQSRQEFELDPRPVDEAGRIVSNIMMSETEEHPTYTYNLVENALKIKTTVNYAANPTAAQPKK